MDFKKSSLIPEQIFCQPRSKSSFKQLKKAFKNYSQKIGGENAHRGIRFGKFINGIVGVPKSKHTMQIVIQNISSGEVLGLDGWTADFDEAVDFGTAVRAVDYCKSHQMEASCVLTRFTEDESWIKVPCSQLGHG